MMRSILFFTALMLFSCGGKPSEDAPIRVRMGNEAPGFTLESIEGKKVSLEDFKGKVVLLDFWATWCPPCRMSTPVLKRLQEKMKGKDFQILSISVDEEKELVPLYIHKEKVKFPVLYVDMETEAHYLIRSLPTFFLLDKKGVVAKAYQGFDPVLELEWMRQIELLLKS